MCEPTCDSDIVPEELLQKAGDLAQWFRFSQKDAAAKTVTSATAEQGKSANEENASEVCPSSPEPTKCSCCARSPRARRHTSRQFSSLPEKETLEKVQHTYAHVQQVSLLGSSQQDYAKPASLCHAFAKTLARAQICLLADACVCMCMRMRVCV